MNFSTGTRIAAKAWELRIGIVIAALVISAVGCTDFEQPPAPEISATARVVPESVNKEIIQPALVTVNGSSIDEHALVSEARKLLGKNSLQDIPESAREQLLTSLIARRAISQRAESLMTAAERHDLDANVRA